MRGLGVVLRCESCSDAAYQDPRIRIVSSRPFSSSLSILWYLKLTVKVGHAGSSRDRGSAGDYGGRIRCPPPLPHCDPSPLSFPAHSALFSYGILLFIR